MSELNDVAGGETIASTFTNQVKERTVMRYASAAGRDTSIPAPVSGSLAYLQDSDTVTMYDGTNWVALVMASGAVAMTAALDMGGNELLNVTGIRDTGNVSRMIPVEDGPLNLYGESGGAPKQTVSDTGTAFAAPARVTEAAQNLGDNLARNVVINIGEPTITVRGSLWIDPTAGTLAYSDGAAWIVAITGV